MSKKVLIVLLIICLIVSFSWAVINQIQLNQKQHQLNDYVAWANGVLSEWAKDQEKLLMITDNFEKLFKVVNNENNKTDYSVFTTYGIEYSGKPIDEVAQSTEMNFKLVKFKNK